MMNETKTLETAIAELKGIETLEKSIAQLKVILDDNIHNIQILEAIEFLYKLIYQYYKNELTIQGIANEVIHCCGLLKNISDHEKLNLNIPVQQMLDWARAVSIKSNIYLANRGSHRAIRHYAAYDDSYADKIDTHTQRNYRLLLNTKPDEGFFYYALLGDYCNNKQCVKNTTIKLTFSIQKLSESAVKAVGKKLKGLDCINISVIAEAYTRTFTQDESWLKTLWLTETDDTSKPTNIEFNYQADNSVNPEAGFLVSIDYRGKPIYSFWLAVSVDDELDKQVETNLVSIELNLDELPSSQNKPSDLYISLKREKDDIRVFVKKNDDDLEILNETLDISITTFQQMVNTANLEIDNIANQELWNYWSIENKNGIYKDELLKLKKISWELIELLKTNTSLNQLINAVEALPPGSTITINTNTVGFPWDILYTEKDEDFSIDNFWGIRYKIECLRQHAKATIQKKYSNQKANEDSPLNLVCVIDDAIDSEHKNNITNKLKLQLSPQFVNSCCNKKAALTKAGNEHCIYIFCHGSSEQPLVSDGYLLLEENSECKIKPIDVWNTKNQLSYECKPLVIINSCSGAVISPFAVTSFSETFSLKNAQGIVGPLFSVPTSCALTMGEALLEGYLVDKKTIGETLSAIRRQWLNAYNPVPLFYQLQCDRDAKL